MARCSLAPQLGRGEDTADLHDVTGGGVQPRHRHRHPVDGAQRLALSPSVRAVVGQRVVLTVVGDRFLPRQDLANDTDVFPGACQGLAASFSPERVFNVSGGARSGLFL